MERRNNMNKLTIIGNLTRDPEYREVNDGVPCVSFSVAVNRRVRSGQAQQTDYFRVTAWRGLGETCAKYLMKGKKVCVVGPVTAHSYTDNNGQARASLEMTAEDVEFLTPRGSDDYVEETDGEDNPFSGE